MPEYGEILQGDACEVLASLPDASVHCCVTSPPYWGLKDYQAQGQIGLEVSPREYITSLLHVFGKVRRVLREDGTLWLNLGDTYIGYHGNKNAIGGVSSSDRRGYKENMRATTVGLDGLKNKDLAGIPWRVALALQDAGWYLRSDIIWHKPNATPESVKDRPTKAHEYIFLLAKSPKYYFDADAIREPATSTPREINPNQNRRGNGAPDYQPNSPTRRSWPVKRGAYGTPQDLKRNKRTVWSVNTCPYADAHFATFPPDLIRPCILAGCPSGGTVLDPFFGTGTVGEVCFYENRRFIGIELNPQFLAMARKRLNRAIERPVQFTLWQERMEETA